MQPRTHLALDPRLCGTLRALSPGQARVELTTTQEMAADDHGLVHGGFVFGLADAAAMFAIDEPNVVLGSAETRFLAPVVVGDVLLASASVARVEGKKHFVEVEVSRVGLAAAESRQVFQGTFVCFVPAQHVLASRGAP